MKPADITLSLITVNYAHTEFIAQLADSLEKNPPGVNYEWILIDNGSRRGEGKILKKMVEHHDNWHVIELSENRGFGAGNNEGVRFAHGEYVALVNPDVKVTKDLFPTLIENLKDEKVGMVAPALKDFQGNDLVTGRRFPNFWSMVMKRLFRRSPKPYSPAKKGLVPVEWIHGSFLVMRKKFFEKLRGFDERFFLFLEDTDLCRRTWEAGKKVLINQDVSAYHNTERLSGHDLWRALRSKTAWIHLFSFLKYFKKYLGRKKPDVF